MAKRVQSAMCCPCGREKILANGLCASCYNLKRQDAEYFGGLREAVLERDGNRCRVCDAPGGRKREMIVHHRVPGKSVLALMISLCPGCHAKVHRTKAVLTAWPPLLLVLWREQHPTGHEQTAFSFEEKKAPERPARLFVEDMADISASEVRIPHQLRGSEAEAFARLDSPAERLRYLEGTVGLSERDALRCLSAWVEALSVKARTKEPDAGAIAERQVEYEISDAPAYED